MRTSNERGIAMITVMLVLMLISALLVGFTTVVMSDQRFRFIDHDRGQAFYAADGGTEKVTADLGNTFFGFIAPTAAQISAIVATASVPVISGITFTGAAPSVLPGSALRTDTCGPTQTPPTQIVTAGTAGYTIMYCGAAGTLNPTNIQPANLPIKTGPYDGLVGLQTPYQIDVTARTSTGGEVHLVRTIEAVAIPVFQFGTFSDVDLAFFAGPNFGFGGRVHTNGNLFLAQGTGNTLTLSGKVTAVKDVIRQQLQNGQSIDVDDPSNGHTGTVSMASSSSSFRPLQRTEGSLVGGLGSAVNAAWHNVSLSTYNSWIRNGATGAKALTLPLVTVGGTNTDLIRRPLVGETTTNPVLYNERMYTKASLRILLSDTAADIMNLPGVTQTNQPVLLDGDWVGTPPAGITVNASHPPVARSGVLATATTTAATTAGTTTSFSVNAMPAMFQRPQLLSAKNAAGTYQTGPFSCTTWTETTLSGCNYSVALTSGWTIYVSSGGNSNVSQPGNMPGAPAPTLTLNNNFNTGVGKVLTFNNQQSTWGFSQTTFWMVDSGAGGTGAATLVTCLNVSGTTFSNCNNVPTTKSGATITNAYASTQNTGVLGGYIKIERQDSAGAWWDVTSELLNYGITGSNLAGEPCAGTPNTGGVPNAIIQLQRVRDNGANPATTTYCPTNTTSNAPNGTTGGVATTNSYDFWPNALFDTREGIYRDVAPTGNNNLYIPLGGVMYYVALDVTNLSKWFTATAPYNGGTGASSQKNNGGFTVYFSDRRNNRNATSVETGEYGFEDFVNPLSATGTPSGTLDTGEDVNGNLLLDVYGGVANANGAANSVPFGVAPLTAAATPTTMINPAVAQVNREILFRRALKLINGNNIVGLGVTGLTVVSENPVYVQGDWNSWDSGTGVSDFNGTDAATAVIADAVTLLSNGWNDVNSFSSPYVYSPCSTCAPVVVGRQRGSQSWYRLAIIGGKGMAFPWINATPTDFGTDGGAHNFLRFLENGDQAVNYLGATATFFYNRQGVGTYKCCTTVYGAPTRNFQFDVNFMNPALLPPNTPVFRDMNAVGFSQELRPGK